MRCDPGGAKCSECLWPPPPPRAHPLPWVAECLHARLDRVHRVHGCVLRHACCCARQHVLCCCVARQRGNSTPKRQQSHRVDLERPSSRAKPSAVRCTHAEERWAGAVAGRRALWRAVQARGVSTAGAGTAAATATTLCRTRVAAAARHVWQEALVGADRLHSPGAGQHLRGRRSRGLAAGGFGARARAGAAAAAGDANRAT